MEDISRLSRSPSSFVHADISDSGSVEEMSQKHHKLGAKPMWSAHHADWRSMSDKSSATPIPPWRDKSLWRTMTTKTVEGLMSEQPSCGVKQKFEGLYEALSKKHAMEYARLLKEYEEMTRLFRGKKRIKKKWREDQGLNSKMEEMLSMTKDIAGKSNLSRSESRYEEMLSLVKEIAGKVMEQKSKEGTEVVKGEVSWAGESRKNGEDDQEKMEQLLSTSQNENRGVNTARGQKNMNSLDFKEANRRMIQAGRLMRRIKKKKARKDEVQKKK